MPSLMALKSGLIFLTTCNLSSSVGFAARNALPQRASPQKGRQLRPGPNRADVALGLTGLRRQRTWPATPPFLSKRQAFSNICWRNVDSVRVHWNITIIASEDLQTYLQDIGVSVLEELSPTILSAFVTARGQQWGKSAISALCAALRVFLRYLHREGLIRRDLSSSVDSPKRYRLAEIPRSISWTDVGRMLEAVDRRTAVGRRDYAILLLLVTYGLRSREIAALTLEDLDWQRERLRVPERKAGHSTAYPLSPIVGEAILDYLKHGRPKTSDRHIFFRVLAPLSPLTAEAISSRAAYYLHMAGVTVARAGSHTLRHTCVQRLVDAHFSLKTIGDYVGHRSPDSTMIYSKVDVGGPPSTSQKSAGRRLYEARSLPFSVFDRWLF